MAQLRHPHKEEGRQKCGQENEPANVCMLANGETTVKIKTMFWSLAGKKGGQELCNLQPPQGGKAEASLTSRASRQPSQEGKQLRSPTKASTLRKSFEDSTDWRRKKNDKKQESTHRRLGKGGLGNASIKKYVLAY